MILMPQTWRTSFALRANCRSGQGITCAVAVAATSRASPIGMTAVEMLERSA